jgi:prepilin-type N-terminal cleavage/methylation domain-containing protein
VSPVDGRARNDGFTLVELLVVMLLLGVIGGIVTTGLVSAMTSTRNTQVRIEAMAELQRSAERITRELRAACPITEIDEVDGQSVTLVVHRQGEVVRHRFYRQGDRLLQDVAVDDGGTWVDRRVGVPMLTELPTGQDPIFTFLDGEGGEVDRWQDVSVVRLTLRRDLPEQPAVEVATTASLRNKGSSCD